MAEENPGMKLIYVEWIDSALLTDGGWQSEESLDQLEPMHIVTVGHLYRETDTFITVVSSADKHHYSGDICIPKLAITKRRWLK